MVEKITIEDVDSTPYRIAELLFVVPLGLLAIVGIGVMIAGVLPVPEDAFLAVGGLGYLGLVLFALLARVAVPVVLYLDTRNIAATAVDWDPTPALWALGGFFLTVLLGLHFLYKRHQYVVDRVERDWWWIGVLVGAVVPVLAGGVAIAVGGDQLGPQTGLAVGLALVAVAVFPVAIYRDASFVRLQTRDWQPNPGTYFGLAVILLAAAPLVNLVMGGYFLFRRQRTIGLA
jgi:hypothetical protein